jgi:hypothetical protein
MTPAITLADANIIEIVCTSTNFFTPKRNYTVEVGIKTDIFAPKVRSLIVFSKNMK